MYKDIILQVQDLKKYFGPLHAVDGVNLSVSRGQVYGFLGPNGSGKTTTIGMILGLIHPTVLFAPILHQETIFNLRKVTRSNQQQKSSPQITNINVTLLEIRLYPSPVTSILIGKMTHPMIRLLPQNGLTGIPLKIRIFPNENISINKKK